MKPILKPLFLFGLILFISAGCEKQYKGMELFIFQPTQIAMQSVLLRAYADDNDQNYSSYELGFCWNNTGSPTLKDSSISISLSSGHFEFPLEGLFEDSTYYIRAYAAYSSNEIYSDVIVFKTLPPTIGQNFEGGIVMYLDSSQEHGFVTAEHYFESHGFGCPHLFVGQAMDSAIGSGELNTKILANLCWDFDAAPWNCYHYNNGPYDDWYLPSIHELQEIYKNKDSITLIPTTNENWYWSSTQVDTGNAKALDFSTGKVVVKPKNSNGRVIPVRDF